jgi:hypothetical protein
MNTLYYMNYANFPKPGILGNVYIATDTGESWIWTGSASTGSYRKRPLDVTISNPAVFQGEK